MCSVTKVAGAFMLVIETYKTINMTYQAVTKLHIHLVFTTQVNSAFCAHWLASSEVISQVLFTSQQQNKNKIVFVGILSQLNLLFRLLVFNLCGLY